MKTLLFVYGTLKRGCSNHAMLAGETFLGEARTHAGFRLYDLGGYPGIVVLPEDREGVTGEVWAVGAEALQRLDAFEGVHEGLYRRGRIPLQPPFAEQSIEAYFSALGVQGRPEVGPTWIEKQR
jgi:gamma-glutamylaminecyclotransferase